MKRQPPSSRRILSRSIAALLLCSAAARAQTYTGPGGLNFTNPNAWDFGAGSFGIWSIPASDAALALNFLTYGGTAQAPANDLNLTLNTLNLDTFNTGGTTIGSALGGDFAFAGAAKINVLGTGATTISAPIVLGSSATGLTFDGAGAGGITISGAITSNTGEGAALHIATEARNATTGTVTLSGNNSFAGGVTLDSGALLLNSARALGDRTNVLTVNGGVLRLGNSSTVANNLTLNSTLDVLSFNTGMLSGVLSGLGGVTNGSSGTDTSLGLTGMNTYTGATTIRGVHFAAAGGDLGGIISISGAAGSILSTSSISVSEGGVLRLNYDQGNSATNARVSTSTGIGVTSGFLEIIGNAGVIRQNLGAVNAGGLTTVLATTNGAGTGAAGAATEVTIANLSRTAGGAITFTGPNLGGTAVAAGLAAAQGNIILTQINGAAPGAALVGGGGAAGTTSISILPWALGDTSNINNSLKYAAGTGFVTYGANGVRLLNPTTEYNTTNNFATVGATENMRITGSVTHPTGPITVNSLFLASTQTIDSWANPLTIASGSLATNAGGSIFGQIKFGMGGSGEAVVSVVDQLDGTKTLQLLGSITAASLVKNGHGTLELGLEASSANVIAGPITINGGRLKIHGIANLGGATSLTFNSPSNNHGATLYFHGGVDTLTTSVTTNGGAAVFDVVFDGSTLNLDSNISGAGGIRKDGSGTLILRGGNTYSGGTYLGEGTLDIDSDARLGSNADPTTSFFVFEASAHGTLRLSGTWNSARAISLNGFTTLNTQANNATLFGSISGTSGRLTKQGAGTLMIGGGDNAYSGTIFLGDGTTQGGTLALVGSGALNSASVTFGSSGAPVGAYIFDLSGATTASGTPWRSLAALNSNTSFTQAHEVKLGASAGAPVDLRITSGTFGGSAGVVTGFGKLVKVGTGALTLNGQTASTFTGGVEVWGGTLAITADNQLGNASNILTLAGGTLSSTAALARPVSLAATPQPIISASTTVTLVNGFNSGAGAVTLNGAVSGPGGFNVLGTMIFGTANSYAGDTQIGAGAGASAALLFSDPNQLGGNTSRIRLNMGGTSGNGLNLTASPGVATNYPLGHSIIVTAAANKVTVTGSNATLDLDRALLSNSTSGFSKEGAGQLRISADNSSFFGTLTIGNGSSATGNGALAGTGQFRRATVNLATLAVSTFDLSGLTRELGALGAGVTSFATGNTVALGTGGALTTGFNNSTMTWAGSITGDASAAVTKVGTGILTLTSNTHTFGGGFHLLSGNAAFSTGGTLPAQSVFTLGGWGTTANAGPRFTIDNSGTNIASRLDDAQIIHSNSGEISYAGFASAASIETVGSLRGAGMSTVTMVSGGTLNFADSSTGLTRVDRGSFLFLSSAVLGSAAASTTVPNVTFGNSGTLGLTGGGGAAGTPTVSIIPYATGTASTTGGGSNFVTYGANGIRLLTTPEFNQNLLTASATQNVWVNPSALNTVTLAGGVDRTVNAVLMSGSAFSRLESTASESLILGSGAFVNANISNVFTTNAAGTIGIPLGIQTAGLRAGAGDSLELHLHTNASGDLAVGVKVTTSGGLTKSGAGNLYLTNTANTYIGQTTINAGSLVIDNKAALGSSTSLVIGGGFLKYRGVDTMLTGFTVKAAGGAAAGLGASAGFQVVSGTTLTLPAASVSGNGGILKDGTGVLKLTGTNTNSGATIISGGALAIDGPAALGTNGRVIFGTGLSTSGGQTLRFDAPMTLTQDFITNTADAGIGIGFDTNGNDVTLSGTILSTTSTRGLFKIGAGNLTLTATEMFTGATQVYAGTLTLAGANGSIVPSTNTGGYLTAASTLLFGGGSLVLDNTGANHNNRLPDVWDSPFGSGDGANGGVYIAGGELKIRGNAGTATSERINRVNLQVGTITLENNGQNVTLTSGRLFRQNALTTGLIRGRNLGATPSATSTNFFVTDLGGGGTQLTGAGGAEGTPFVSILAGIVGDTSATGNGTELTTYAADTGVRLLTASEYTSTIPAGNFDTSRAPNVALSGAANVGAQTSISALKLGAGASVSGGGALTLTASTVLATGSASINTPVLRAESNAGYAFVTAGAGTTLTINSTLNGAGFFKYGDGTLALTNRYFAGGSTSIVAAQGTLLLSSANAGLSPIGASLFVLKGATFDLGGMDRTIASLSNLGGIGGAQAAGQVQSEGTLALGANRLTLYDSPAFTWPGSITGSGGLTKAFFASLTSTFTAPLAFTGSTVIRAGILQLSGAGTLASTSIEIRGGALQFTNTDDNAFAGGYIANRIGASVPITLAGGGVVFTENANTPANHHLGATTLAGGSTLGIATGSTAPSTTTFANLIRGSSERGTLTISATNLGLAQSPIGNARVFATQINGDVSANAFVGGGGAVGTTTQNILPWAWSSTANSFLTYGVDGFRPLATTGGEYATAFGGNASDNLRTTSAVALSGPTTANSLIHASTGAISGAFDLTLTSGAFAVTSATTIGVNTNALFTGAGDTRELVINNTAATTLNYNLATSGGVTKFGAGTLTLSGTNPFANGLVIANGAVSFSNDNQLGASGGSIRFGGASGSPATLTYTGGTTLAFNRPVETLSLGNFTGVANRRWQLNQPVTGAGGVRFVTANSIFDLNAANTYTGPTQLTSGNVYITNDASLGNGGEVLFSGGNLVTRGDWTSNRIVHVTTTGSSINTNGSNTTWSGQFIGGSTFAKSGQGNLTFTEAMPYSSTLTVNAGSLVLKDRGSLAAGAISAGVNGTVTLDDTGPHFPDRANDGGTLTLGAGNLTLKGGSSTLTEEVINTLALTTGPSTVTLTPGSGQAAILRLATGATVAAPAATLFRGTNLGVNAPGTADSASLILTNVASQTANAFVVTGGGAPGGNASISIIKGAFGDISATGLGTQLVTYDLEKGVRLLNPNTEYTTTLADGSVMSDNVKIDASTKILTVATTANALWLKDGAALASAGALTLSSGTMLVTGAGNTVSAIIANGANVFAIGGPGNVTFNTTNGIAGSGGLSKMGAGAATFNAANSYTGSTWLHSGVVNAGNANAFANGSNTVANAVRFLDGEFRNTSGSPLTIPNTVVIDGTMRIGGAQDVAFSGAVNLNNATREINVTNSGTTTLSGSIVATTTNLGFGLIKTGAGRLDLTSASNTYDGQTTVQAGELRVISSIATSNLTLVAGGTLSGIGTVGALALQSGVLAPGADGAGTLNAGDTAFAGGTFSIEIASASSADQLNVTGTASLTADTALSLSLLGGFTPMLGQFWVLVNNDGADPFTTGSFRFTIAGDPIQDTTPFTAAGNTFTLQYNAGSGNDVVLYAGAIPEPSTAAFLAGSLSLLGFTRRARSLSKRRASRASAR